MEGWGLGFGVYGYGSGVKLLDLRKYHKDTKSIKREKKSARETFMKL